MSILFMKQALSWNINLIPLSVNSAVFMINGTSSVKSFSSCNTIFSILRLWENLLLKHRLVLFFHSFGESFNPFVLFPFISLDHSSHWCSLYLCYLLNLSRWLPDGFLIFCSGYWLAFDDQNQVFCHIVAIFKLV